MTKITNSGNLKIALMLLIFTFSIMLFQGQYYGGHVFDDDNPDIEQPTLEAFMSYKNFNSGSASSGIVTINDYDNFDIGVDYYEQNATVNPENPLLYFFGVNASPQNARITTNGGINWILNNPSYHSSTCCDPWSTYTGNGILIYASGVNGQYVYRSTNHGLNWSAPILSVSGYDRNHVSAEYTGTGPYANYVYAGITPGNFGRSTDAGLTWTTTFNPSNTQPGCYIAVGPNDTVNGGCVIYVTNTGSTASRTYNFYRSTNGGSNFTLMSSQNFVGYVGTLNSVSRFVINGARTAPHPKIVMDNSNGPYRGRLYLVYATNDPPGNGMKPDVWLRYSTDQGATWSAQTRINDNIDPQSSDQWFPEIYCVRETGKLYIHWYDDRNNPSGYGVDVYATYTTDGGATFAPNQRLTNVTFTYPNPPCSPNSNCYRGDYTSIAGSEDAAFSVWGDHRSGSALNMGSYFPDFAMRVSPAADTIHGNGDSSLYFASIPGVKLWDKTTKFSWQVSPMPTAGSITANFLNRATGLPLDSLTAYPDSLRIRIRTSGGVPNGVYNITIKANGTKNVPVHVRNITLTVINPVGIVYNGQIPDKFSLSQNYPNPFNPSTVISYHLAVSSFVKLIIYDALGKELATLVNELQPAGQYSIEWIAGKYPSGVYFYTIKTPEFTDTRRMMLLK